MPLDSAQPIPSSQELKVGKVQPYLEAQPQRILPSLKDSARA